MDLGFKEKRLNEIFAKIKIPKYLRGKGSKWIIKNLIRKNIKEGK